MPYEEFTVSKTPGLKQYIESKAKLGDTYFQSVLERVNERNTITDKQMAVIKKNQAQDKQRKDRYQLPNEDGQKVGVVNVNKRDGKPLCFISTSENPCRNLAAVAVGLIGVCEDHIQEGHEREDAWQAEHAKTNREPISGRAAAEADGAKE